MNLPAAQRDQPFEPVNDVPKDAPDEGSTEMIRFGRIAIAAALVTAALAIAETQGAWAGADAAGPAAGPVAAPAAPVAPPAIPTAAPDVEKPACPRVKVVYFGYGEAERSPCRTAAR